jgi:hypothetical protein
MRRILPISLCVGFLAGSAFAQAVGVATATLKKVVIPIVGSTPGANGAHFKTSLRIPAWPGTHGRIVFHPLGAIGSDNDPTIRYSVPETANATDFLEYDDIVAAMGQSGLGSLDIIPDPDGANFLPDVTARVYNDTPDGTFGSEEQDVFPVKYFAAPTRGVQSNETLVPAMSSQYRRSIGFRTLSRASLSAIIIRKDGSRVDKALGSFRGEYTTMMTVEDFARNLMGTTIGPDDALIVFATGEGKAIIFYTYTDNGTNDPTVVVSPPFFQPLLLNEIPS